MYVNRLAALFIIIGCLLFGMGYHGVDIAWNMHTVNRDYNASYMDQSLGGNVWYTEGEAYRQGIYWMFMGFVAAIYGSLYINYEYKLPSFRRKKKQAEESDNLLIKQE